MVSKSLMLLMISNMSDLLMSGETLLECNSSQPKKIKITMLPPQVKATVDRFSHFVTLTDDKTKNTTIWNSLKQELGQLQWALNADGVKGGGRVTSKSAFARASGATEECLNPEANTRAVRAYVVLCKLDNYRRATECKWKDSDGKLNIDADIQFTAVALPYKVRDYLMAFCAVPVESATAPAPAA